MLKINKRLHFREKQRIVASERDKKIFFDAVFADQEPNQVLKRCCEKL